MPTPQKVARIEALIWVLIYGGLFAVILGLASMAGGGAATGWALIALGVVIVAAGMVLIWVRSRFGQAG